jgi:hypothetical protein
MKHTTMKHTITAGLAVLVTSLTVQGAETKTGPDTPAVKLQSPWLNLRISLKQPAFEMIAVDSLGGGKCSTNVLRAPAVPLETFVARPDLTRGVKVEYRLANAPADSSPGWTILAGEREITLISACSGKVKPAAMTFEFNTSVCRATLLGLFNQDGTIALPVVLHLPGQGTFRITAPAAKNAALGYESGEGFVKVKFPPATESAPRIEYHLEVTTIYPRLPGIDTDKRFDAFRRDWLNIFQLNPARRVLSNHAASDTCAFCYYEYADVALRTPPLAENLTALDLVRQTLEYILAGKKAYGMPGYGAGAFPVESSDTFPSLLIAARDYVSGTRDLAWLRANYAGIKAWADKMIATDRNGNGLIEYSAATGNSGSWNEGKPSVRPSNWWDTIGFGHEDAYANALAYRALRGMEAMAGDLREEKDNLHYRTAADKLKAAYFTAFYNPDSGVLAGWRSADGQLHDYYFLFVNGAAIHYGLVPREKANDIMDRLMARIKKVGYTRFDMGLPGNLVSVARKDYAHKDRRFGGGSREDNADGFEIYENGGATACFAYFTLAALYDLGRREEADRILLPMLAGFDQGGFEGQGANGMSNDWRKWDGTPMGYEGFLTDNYYALLAVVNRAAKDHAANEQ